MMVTCVEQGLQDRTWDFLIANNGSVPFTISSAGLAIRIWVYESQLRCSALTGSNGNVYNSSGVQVGAMQLTGNIYNKNTSMTEIDESSTHKANQYGTISITYQTGVSVIPAGGWMQGFAIYETSAGECGNTAGNWDNFADDYSGLPATQTSCTGSQSGPYFDDHHFALYSNGTLLQEVKSGGTDDPQSGFPPGGGTCTPTMTSTNTKTLTPTSTPTFTKTFSATPTYTPTKTPTSSVNTPTFTKTPTPTFTNTLTPSPSSTNSFTPTPTYTKSSTPTPTFTKTFTPSATFTNSFTPSPTFTNSFTPTPTYTKSYTPSPTFTNSLTPTPTYTKSFTPSPTVTYSFTPTPPSSTCLDFGGIFAGPGALGSSGLVGLAMDNSNNVYAADNDIVVLGSTGVPGNPIGNGVLVDPQGIAVDSLHQTIYTVDATLGKVYAFGFNGMPKWSTNALPGGGQLETPLGVTLDGNGNVWVTDSDLNEAVEYSMLGAPETAIGGGVLSFPEGIAVDGHGDVFVGNGNDEDIVEFNPSYAVSQAFSGNGTVDDPYQLQFDGNGNLWVADDINNQVEEFNGQGSLLYVLNGPSQGTGALQSPMGLAVAPNGALFVAENGNQTIEEFGPCGTPTVTMTFTPAPTVSLCLQLDMTFSQLGNPGGVVVDGQGNIYVDEEGSSKVDVFAPNGNWARSFPTGANPWGMVQGSNGDLYVAEFSQSRVEVFNPASGASVSLIGVGQLVSPMGVALDGSGNVYVGDYGGGRAMEFPATGNPVTFGQGLFSNPGGVAVNNLGDIYFGDYSGTQIRAFHGGTPSTPFKSWSGVSEPTQMRFDTGGFLWETDRGTEQILVWDPNNTGAPVTTVPQTLGHFDSLLGHTADIQGNLYVADWGAGQLDKLSPCGDVPTVTPTATTGPTPCLSLGISWTNNLSTSLGIFYGRDGKVYVMNFGLAQIQVFSPEGAPLSSFGAPGAGPAQFNSPYGGILQGRDGNIYVGDNGNNRITVVDTQGNPAGVTFIGAGQGAPWGQAFGPADNLYVTYPAGNKVLEYRTDGTLIRQFGSGAPGPILNQLNTPQAVAVDAQGNVYVWEAGVQRIQVFNSQGAAQRTWNTSGLNLYQMKFDSQGFL
ncbi:MAG TPA: NHL repeat-containing protein, partial [bacterium]|nr:NHL repeat-containing protein [bacterium]